MWPLEVTDQTNICNANDRYTAIIKTTAAKELDSTLLTEFS